MRGGGETTPGIIPLTLKDIFGDLYEKHG